jgi:hypothetical protein
MISWCREMALVLLSKNWPLDATDMFICSVFAISASQDILFQSSCTGANFDIFLKAKPYFMNRNGTGIAIVATPLRIDIAGPTPRLWNISIAAKGNPAARILRRKVFAETALAA